MKNLIFFVSMVGIVLLFNSSQAVAGTESITCQSWLKAYVECGASGRIRSARLTRKLSNSSCRQGTDWGFRGSNIWVNHGCRAVFQVRTNGGPGPGPRPVRLDCESIGHSYHECRIRGRIRDAYVTYRYSNAPCQEGYDWGYWGDTLWVDNGCRAEFEVYLRRRR
ncbi:hypothetical protein COB52_05930 [Candidatus Kaiserbacteria bacterium]|nr:MAG: hypothetical protein COB52_05930 [Candidatus Kaiserbacteria bacterium]